MTASPAIASPPVGKSIVVVEEDVPSEYFEVRVTWRVTGIDPNGHKYQWSNPLAYYEDFQLSGTVIYYKWRISRVQVLLVHKEEWLVYEPPGCAPDKRISRVLASREETEFPYAAGTGRVFVHSVADLAQDLYGESDLTDVIPDVLDAPAVELALEDIATDMQTMAEESEWSKMFGTEPSVVREK